MVSTKKKKNDITNEKLSQMVTQVVVAMKILKIAYFSNTANVNTYIYYLDKIFHIIKIRIKKYWINIIIFRITLLTCTI